MKSAIIELEYNVGSDTPAVRMYETSPFRSLVSVADNYTKEQCLVTAKDSGFSSVTIRHIQGMLEGMPEYIKL